MADKLKVTSFVKKLFALLEDTSAPIKWSPCGSKFILYDMNQFQKETLPRYFKHCNFASFQRQLNIYNFRRAIDNDDRLTWAHELFSPECKQRLHLIQRKKTRGERGQTEESEWLQREGEEENISLREEMQDLFGQFQEYKNKLKQRFILLQKLKY